VKRPRLSRLSIVLSNLVVPTNLVPTLPGLFREVEMNHPGHGCTGQCLLWLVLGIALRTTCSAPRCDEVHVTGVIERANGLFRGRRSESSGERRQVGQHPQGADVKIDFHYDHGYRVPSNAMAAIVAQSGQWPIHPASTAIPGGPVMTDGRNNSARAHRCPRRVGSNPDRTDVTLAGTGP